MTRQEAEENIAALEADTAPAAMKRLIEVALGPLGRLSDSAREVYEAKLRSMS
jgi:hypothetical protein